MRRYYRGIRSNVSSPGFPCCIFIVLQHTAESVASRRKLVQRESQGLSRHSGTRALSLRGIKEPLNSLGGCMPRVRVILPRAHCWTRRVSCCAVIFACVVSRVLCCVFSSARADVQAAGEVEMGEGERIAPYFECPAQQGQLCDLLAVTSWVSNLYVSLQTLEELLSLRPMRSTLCKRRNVYLYTKYKYNPDVAS